MGGKPANKDGAAIIAIKNDPEGGIVLQHDARYLPNGTSAIFDNQSLGRPSQPARAASSTRSTSRRAPPTRVLVRAPGERAELLHGLLPAYPDGHRVIGWG